jgi:hemicentin
MLTAHITGYPKPQVTWLYKGQPLKASATKYQIDAKKDDIYTLTILKGDVADDGQYTVMAENIVDKIQVDTKIAVCTKPKVEKIADATVNIGDNARLQCQYSGQPSPTITWFKDGKPIETDDQRISIISETSTLSVLTITSTTMDDKGVYSVKVSNNAGDVEGKANLNVKRKSNTNMRVIMMNYACVVRIYFLAIKPTITRDLNGTYVGNKGDELILSIVGTGNPYPVCQWSKNNVEISSTNSDEHYQFKDDPTTNEYCLVIKSTSQDDIGDYQAQLTNAAGLVKSKKSKINIQKQPTFIEKPQTITVDLSATASIECRIDALPQAKVTWSIGGKSVSPKDGYETSYDGKTGLATLTIKNVTVKHANTITIKAENTVGIAEETVNINVRSAPILIKSLVDTEIVTGNDVTLLCEFQASPQATVQWFLNEQVISTIENKYDVIDDTNSNQYRLVIKNVVSNDIGVYRLQASNELGQIQTECKLNVINAPNFLNGLQERTVLAKESIEFHVQVTGTPQPTLTWLKAGKEIKIDEKKYSLSPMNNDGQCTLLIKDAAEDDQAVYSCVAKNKLGTCQTDGQLKVTAPLSFVQILHDTDVLSTQNAVLTCEVQGIPKANIKW